MSGVVGPEAVTNQTLDKLLEMYFPVVREKIYLRASDLSGGKEPTAKDFMAAIQEYIPGEPFIPTKQRWSWINQNVTGFMFITAIMAIAFGIFGVYAPSGGFIEIAKIFAGALVGGAAGAAAGSRRT